MKKCFFHIFIILSAFTYAQKNNTYLSTDIFYGYAIEHDKKLAQTIQGNPTGIILSWDTKNANNSNWENYHNFPDSGYSFIYENFNGEILGEFYSLFRHYNFHISRQHHLALKVAIGLGYNTSPYHEIHNKYNFAIGSNLLASAYLKLNYQKEFLKDRLGFNTGISLIHYSNASFKNPNLGINTLAINLGLNYNLNREQVKLPPKKLMEKAENPILFNLAYRTGFNQSLIVGSDLYPFHTLSLFGSKKINFKSTLTAGVDLFISEFLKYHIIYEDKDLSSDYKRIGIFAGHELFINQFSVISQVGFNLYYPYPYISRIYERFGFKRNIGKKLFSALTLKINMFRAESLEFGLGYQF